MQLIILIFLSFYSEILIYTQDLTNIKQKKSTSYIDSIDPYNCNLIFDPSIPNKSPNQILRQVQKTKPHKSNFHFTIFPRSIYNDKYFLLGQESLFVFSSINQTYTNFTLNKQYKDAEVLSSFNINQKYFLNFNLKYQKVLSLPVNYSKIKILSSLQFNQSFFSQIKLSIGALSSNNAIWPIVGFGLGKPAPPLSYNSYKSFFWLNTYVFSKVKESAFFKADINYKFSYLLSSSSIINISLKYLYASIDTPVSEQIKLGSSLRAYDIFEPINTKKLFYIAPSYSLLLGSRLYCSFLYEGGFLINSLGDISIKNLKSSYSIELGYISASLKAVKYFIYYAIGENSDYKIMLGIKY